ncbi:UNVERIFIED_CONTAM: hypothetical protein FKN15_056806 [Acipenser sinensis]
MHDRTTAVPQEAIAGGEPGPVVVLGLALFSAAVTWQFSPLLFLAAYARAAADRQHLVPVRPVLKGETAPAPLHQVVVEAEAAPAALLLAKAARAPPLLAAKAAGAPPLLVAKAAGAPPLLAAKAAGAPLSSHVGGGGTSRYSPSAGGGLGCGRSAFPLLAFPLLGCGHTDSPF